MELLTFFQLCAAPVHLLITEGSEQVYLKFYCIFACKIKLQQELLTSLLEGGGGGQLPSQKVKLQFEFSVCSMEGREERIVKYSIQHMQLNANRVWRVHYN